MNNAMEPSLGKILGTIHNRFNEREPHTGAWDEQRIVVAEVIQSFLAAHQLAEPLLPLYELDKTTGKITIHPPAEPRLTVLREKVENVLRMAKSCDSKGMAETPQHEWTPYQGKILAYEHVLTLIDDAMLSAEKDKP